jgi:hypothetical protein
MEPFANPQTEAEFGQPPRCTRCFYRLDGLNEPRCPECGRTFDPQDPTTYTRRPPFVFWTYWLPGMALSLACGFVCLTFFALIGDIGWAATLGVPLAMGSLIGYGVRFNSIGCLLAAGLGVLAALAASLMVMHPAAVFCIAVITGLFTVPLAVGVGVGLTLRVWLKHTRFSQRAHLPMLLLAISPLVTSYVENRLTGPLVIESVSTEMILPGTPERAWDSLMFYEQVRHEPPVLLKLGLPRPVRTAGDADAPGSVTTCFYVHGHLRKLITEADRGRVLTFDVIDQVHVEDHAVRLIDGSFRFEAAGVDRTRVVLTTRYQPLLRPRFAWRWVEREVVHTLHGHVLEGMRRELVEPTLALEPK